MAETKIPIVFICDKNYTMPTTVALTSLLENKRKETSYDIFIIGVGLREEDRAKLLSQNAPLFSIKIIERENRFEGITEHTHITTSSLFKFYIADIIHDHDKILYLDSDIIVEADLSELYNTDVRNVYAGVVRDMHGEKHGWHKKFNQKLHFNGGVLLLNLKKMRKENLSTKLFETKKIHHKGWSMDQDTLNIGFQERVLPLSCTYNFFSDFKIPGNENAMADFFGITKEEIQRIRKRPAITHFPGLKPWRVLCSQDRKLWYTYFQKSPYKGLKLNHTDSIGDKIKWNAKAIMKKMLTVKSMLQPLVALKRRMDSKYSPES